MQALYKFHIVVVVVVVVALLLLLLPTTYLSTAHVGFSPETQAEDKMVNKKVEIHIAFTMGKVQETQEPEK